MFFIVLYSFIRTSSFDVEDEPRNWTYYPHNLTMSLLHGDNNNDGDNDNERNCNEDKSEIIISSQAASASNGTPPSSANFGCDITHGPNSPMTKRKRTSDA